MNAIHQPTTPGGSGFLIVGAGASIVLTVSLLTLFGMTGVLSTANVRTDPLGFLTDVDNKLSLLGLSVWISALFTVSLGPFFVGLYHMACDKITGPAL